MALENKLGITDSAELARMEEKISKRKALELFESGLLDTFEVGSFDGLANIHKYLFDEIYDFAGQQRTVNIAKGNFRFAPVMYLDAALANINKMPQSTLNEIIEKYVEMNIAHPFREGNGRSTRIWLDAMLKKELGLVVDWSKVDKGDYLLAMERSPIKDIEIKVLLKDALIGAPHNWDAYLKSIDTSYYYEGYNAFSIVELKNNMMPKDWGNAGENAIEFILKNNNLFSKSFVLRNIFVPTGKESPPTEIDVLLLHEKGIFAIESKNLSGVINGNDIAQDQQWEESFSNGGMVNFRSPIQQNQYHIEALAKFLEIPASEITSFVVFSGQCTIQSIPSSTDSIIITQLPAMFEKIRAIIKKAPSQYTHDKIHSMSVKLNEYSQTICPSCRSTLKLRTNSSGISFWGCSTFPKCSYTRSCPNNNNNKKKRGRIIK